MADIKVTSAFVEDVITTQQGEPFALRTSEPHRRKNDRDEWETTARTYRTVKASRDSGVSLFGFVKGDRISFEGVEKTEKRVTGEGARYDLVVWATVLTPLGGGGAANGSSPLPAEASWPSSEGYGDDTPF